jgi:hypothetical protein
MRIVFYLRIFEMFSRDFGVEDDDDVPGMFG